ncbi:protein ELYS-like isoform X2 [Argiope bruennichi]|uniref:protein ELYS-like isoform X2 n=1 Tax=Argiope bruennichi TaxID=94029 RepID=UPI0024956315|nr:protein ELYS-like isoform X2 [Argiope bruennichi]
MRCEVVPSEFSNLVPFSSSSYSSYYPENSENVFGFISKNGLWLYQIHGTVIDIYCIESGKWCGGHCFAKSLKNPFAKITAAVEFTSSHLSYPCLLLAVNQDDESLLCLFDVDSCKVVRAILMPGRVTALDVVSGNGGVCIETHNLSRRLRYMFGVVAIGMLHGHVFFLDLCLDENFNSSERLPSITAVVRQQDFSAEKREAFIARKQHVLLHLNVESSRGSSFEFKSRSSTLGKFPNGDVYMTSLKYIPSLTTLAVGFNFGGIQLWELHHLTLQFTIANDHEQAIINFAFQEPENDPRNFCYLWVFKGHSIAEEELPTTISVATLYSLTYFKREFVESFGALYTELQTCNRRFELPLISDLYSSPNSGTIGSRLMSCQIINQKDLHHALDVASANESDSVSEDMSLCFLSWEVWPNTQHLPLSYHLAVFDLNQWYQAHMPAIFRCHSNELSPYLGIFSMKETMKCLNNEEILSLYAIPQSIKKFKSLLVSEEFFYPSSLSFQQISFSENGVCKTTYFGFQKHLLFEVGELGPQILLNPKEIYPSLMKSGLIPDSHIGADNTPLVVQREMLFQLALEYHLPFFFMKCLREWRYSESIHECCTSKYLLSWAWKRVIHIKNSMDKYTVPLFNCSGEDVDKSSLRHLYSFRKQLNLIDIIMAGYQNHVTPRTEQGIQELQCRKDAILCINMYLQVLLWLRSVNVLPEVCEEEATAKNVVYRLSYVSDSYSLRRARLQKLHSSLASTDVLLIDGLVKESGVSSSWQEKNGTGNYPPPSIYAALAGYLMDGVTIELKHALMYYLLLDLQDMNANSTFLNGLKKFPQIFGLSKSNTKLLKAFWYLDRRDTKNAIKKLLHPAVRVCDILPWQHQRIIKSFLFWKAPQNALKYINHMEPPQTSLEDMKLHLSVLLSCGAITQAYEYQRKKQEMGFGNELLNHLFLGCQELRKMKDLVYLPLNSLESWALVRFLNESKDPRAQELLVIYHLLHCNFFEAAKVNEKLSRLLMNKLASIYETSIHERSIDREALVESLMAAVSHTEKCLVEEMKRLPSDATKKEATLEVSVPLSVSIKCSALKQMSYSDILQSLICKASPCASPQLKTRHSHFEDVPFLRPPVTPDIIGKPVNAGNITPVITKRSRLATSPTEYSSPAKRSRLLDSAPFKPSPLLKRTPKSLAGDIVSLLQTPPIHRRKSSVMKSKILESTPTITPQSILKKKQDSKKQVQLDFHTAPTPPLGSEDESSEDEAMEVDRNLENNLPSNNENMSRQIRFDLPTEAQESKMASSFRLAAQSNVPKSDIFSGRQENSENAKASKETGRTSFGSLTREPLRSLKKRISFHDESSSIKAAEAAMDVEILDNTEEGRKEVSSEKISSLPQIEADISLDREGETGMPISSFIANSEISKPVIDITHTDSTACKTSEDDDVEILLEVQGHGQSFQRSHLSPQLSLRSNFPESKEQKTTFLEGFQSGLLSGSKTSTKIDEKENSPGHSTASEDCFIIEQTLIDDHSENETFYSPCSENLNFTRASFTFSEPVALFQENSNPPAIPEESGSVIENAFSYDFSEQRPPELNRTISFDFAEPSDGILDHGIASLPSNSKFSSVENDMGQFMEDSSESSKPMCTTFCFTENVPIANAESISYTKEENLTEKSSESNFATELEQPQVQMEDTAEPPLQFQFSKPVEEYETVSDEKTVAMEIIESSTCETVTEPLSSSESSISQDKFTFAKPISLKTSEEFSTYLDDKNIEGIAGSDKTLTTSESSIAGKTATIYKPRFTFSKPLSNKIIEETEVPGNEYSKPQITEDNKSELAVELPITTEINATRKSRFTFGKNNNADKTIVKSSASEVNIFESNKSEVASELHIVEENPTVSKHRFTFSKPLPLKPSEELHSVSEKKGSKMDITESDVSTRSRFTFSKPILLSEKTISNEKDANITVSESNTQTEKKQVSITETSLRTSHKTFMFTRSKSTSKTSDDEAKQESENPSEINESNIKTDFLLSETAGTYEEFSSSLKKGASDEGTSEKSGQKTLLSSPHSAAEPESQIHGTSLKTDVKIKANTTKKKTTMKTDKSTATTPSISKKKKGKGKSSQKIEFSFAEPTSPATPEILEILAKTPEVPLPSFMFSPPMTRGRLRKKRMDESMGSSFCSVTSEMSFVSQPPPMDSILEGIIQEKKLEPRRTSKATTKKRSAARKPRPQSHLEISSMSSILDESKMISPSKKSSPSSPKNTSARHSMILRQTKVKHKPENL